MHRQPKVRLVGSAQIFRWIELQATTSSYPTNSCRQTIIGMLYAFPGSTCAGVAAELRSPATQPSPPAGATVDLAL